MHVNVMRSDPGGLHSEEKLIAKYENKPGVTIHEVYSERRPCTGCNQLFTGRVPKVTYRFSYDRSGKSALQSSLDRIKNSQ
jgi:deoxycytidylate deaminase